MFCTIVSAFFSGGRSIAKHRCTLMHRKIGRVDQGKALIIGLKYIEANDYCCDADMGVAPIIQPLYWRRRAKKCTMALFESSCDMVNSLKLVKY